MSMTTHMAADSHPDKWAWLKEKAGFHQDLTMTRLYTFVSSPINLFALQVIQSG